MQFAIVAEFNVFVLALVALYFNLPSGFFGGTSLIIFLFFKARCVVWVQLFRQVG